jgi:hypothetical protein
LGNYNLTEHSLSEKTSPFQPITNTEYPQNQVNSTGQDKLEQKQKWRETPIKLCDHGAAGPDGVLVVESRTCRDFSSENHDIEVWRMRYIQTITWKMLARIQGGVSGI